MAHPLDDTGPLPFAPGESPFHIKGNVYRGHLEWVAENLRGGVEAMNQAFRDPRLAGYMGQRFLASSWYDIVPLVVSAYVVARLAGLSLDDFLRARTRLQAQRDLGGIYRLLLKLTSPENVVARYAAVQQQYFDFGAASARLLAPRRALVERQKLPAWLHEWLVPVQEAFLDVAITAAGARQARTFSRPAVPDGEIQGTPSVTLVCEVSWD